MARPLPASFSRPSSATPKPFTTTSAAAAELVAPELLERVLDEGGVDGAAHVDALRREPVGHVPVDVALEPRDVKVAVGTHLRVHAVVLAAVTHRQVEHDDIDDFVAVDVAVESTIELADASE